MAIFRWMLVLLFVMLCVACDKRAQSSTHTESVDELVLLGNPQALCDGFDLLELEYRVDGNTVVVPVVDKDAVSKKLITVAGLLHDRIKRAYVNLDNVHTTAYKPYLDTYTTDADDFRAMLRKGDLQACLVRDFMQGAFEVTENPMDWAIQGEGFFRITDPDGGNDLYTRNGAFKIDHWGRIVTNAYMPLADDITISDDAVEVLVSPNGQVEVMFSDGSTSDLGQIQLAHFDNPSALQGVGLNMYKGTEESGIVMIVTPGSDSFGAVHQRTLETSGVYFEREILKISSLKAQYWMLVEMIKRLKPKLISFDPFPKYEKTID